MCVCVCARPQVSVFDVNEWERAELEAARQKRKVLEAVERAKRREEEAVERAKKLAELAACTDEAVATAVAGGGDDDGSLGGSVSDDGSDSSDGIEPLTEEQIAVMDWTEGRRLEVSERVCVRGVWRACGRWQLDRADRVKGVRFRPHGCVSLLALHLHSYCFPWPCFQSLFPFAFAGQVVVGRLRQRAAMVAVGDEQQLLLSRSRDMHALHARGLLQRALAQLGAASACSASTVAPLRETKKDRRRREAALKEAGSGFGGGPTPSEVRLVRRYAGGFVGPKFDAPLPEHDPRTGLRPDGVRFVDDEDLDRGDGAGRYWSSSDDDEAEARGDEAARTLGIAFPEVLRRNAHTRNNKQF